MSIHADIGSLDDALAFRIYRVQRLLRLDLVRLLAEHAPDLTPEYFFLLYRLAESDGVRQQALVDPVIGDRPNISRHVVNMERLGFVERLPDPDDGRAQRVHLTDAGRAEIERLKVPVERARERLFGAIDPAMREVFSRVLSTLESTLSG